MKATFILKGKTEDYYESLKRVPAEKAFSWIIKNGNQPKIGNNTIREQVDFNVLKHNGAKWSTPIIEKRKGYNLVTIHLS